MAGRVSTIVVEAIRTMSKERTPAGQEELVCQVAPDVAQSVREIAQSQGRPVSDVVGEAVAAYVGNRPRHAPDEVVMAHYRDSLKKNRRLAELLAQ